MSKKWDLNKKDLTDIGIMVAAYVASFIVVDILPNVDFGKYNPLIASAIPVLTYAINKWRKGR